MSTARLSLLGVNKSFTVPVLRGIDFELRPGEVHALVGENGAGKTTLARIILGELAADAGTLLLDGNPHHPRNLAAARASGVLGVRQELGVLVNLSVAENIFLGALQQFSRRGFFAPARLAAVARPIMDTVGLDGIDPGAQASTLGVGQQQLVEIAAALVSPSRVLILDEPTASLSARETALLHAQIRRLAAAGTSIIYISHRLEEIRAICDRVTVLRDGQAVATVQADRISVDQIVAHMVGRPENHPAAEPPPAGPGPGPSRRSAHPQHAITVQGLRAGAKVHDVSFTAWRGEILGFAGLVGAGRSETMRALFGADRRDAGRVWLGPERTETNIRTPRDAVAAKLALLTENRKEEGLLLSLSLRDNYCTRRRVAESPWIDGQGERSDAQTAFARLRVRAASTEQPINELSGGNQQKVLIAKWLAGDPDIVILDEPTRGIDVQARREIHALLRGLAAQGKTILVVSSDTDELISLCDRVVVMSLGRTVANLEESELQRDVIVSAALTGHRSGGAAAQPTPIAQGVS